MSLIQLFTPQMAFADVKMAKVHYTVSCIVLKMPFQFNQKDATRCLISESLGLDEDTKGFIGLYQKVFSHVQKGF